tara:strand:- start:1446 stop:1892 length:447 start_codon:yes stop_codon:yes gene_type:complete
LAIKLKLSSNFSFTKLADSLDSIIKKQSAKSSEGFAKSAKKKITDGLRPALKKSTREIRRKRGTGGSKPLYETGSLFRSIKATDKGIEMNKYGIYHNEGYETSPKSMIPNKLVPARPFIFPSDKETQKIERNLIIEFYRAMRRNTIIK